MKDKADEGWRVAAAMIDRDLINETYSPDGCDYPRRFLEECTFWGIPGHVADEALSRTIPNRIKRMKLWREHAGRCYQEALDDCGGDERELHERMGAKGIVPWMPKFPGQPAYH